MKALLFRTRVAVLWVAVAVAVTGSLLLYVFVPGALEDMVAGEMEGEALTDAMGYFFATLGTIPLVMAAVTLLIGDRANRYANLIAGTSFGLFGVFAVGSHLAAGDLNAHVLMAALAGVLAFVIAGLGFAEMRRPVPSTVGEASEGRIRERVTV